MKNIFTYIAFFVLALGLTTYLITYLSYHKTIRESNERIEKQSQLLETTFGTMEYAIQGKGMPVLLVHGAGGGYDQGLWLGETTLEKGYQFIAPSKFGYLNSDTPDEYSAKVQAKQYKILLDHIGVDQVIVVAVSAGGPSSMQFANDYPEMVKKLILLSAVSMPPNPNDKSPFYIKLIQFIQKSDYLYWLFTKSFETQILSLIGIPSDEYKRFSTEQKKLAKELLNVMHPMSLRYDGSITDGLIIKNFEIPKNIAAPTLIIHSKNDALVHYSHAEYSNNNIADSKLILYDMGGHGALSELKDARKQIMLFLNN
jgi:pimeloyl-ACP methyl ester carboxylesterase